MNQKQLGILLALVVVIGGAGMFALKNKKSDWSPDAVSGDSGDKVIAEFPLNDVSEISIKDKDGEVSLTKGESGWTVKERGGYAANFDTIHELLRTVWEMEPVQKPKVGESNLGRLALLDPDKADDAEKAAKRVEFKAGGTSHVLRVGKEHMRKQQAQGPMGGGSFPDGRYVMVGDDLTSISLVEPTFSSVTSAPEDWLNKDFIKVEKVKSIHYSPAAAADGWSLTRESDAGDYKLSDKKDGEELDASKTSSLKYFMSSPSFVDVAVGKSDADTGLDKPTQATVETFEGFKYDLSIGKQDDKEQYFLKFDVSATIEKERKAAEDEKPEDKEKLDKEHQEKVEKAEEKLAKEKKLAGTVFVVSKYTVDALLKPRKDLLKAPEKKDDAAAPAGPVMPPSPLVPPVPPAPKTGDATTIKLPSLPSELQKTAEDAVQKTLDAAAAEAKKAETTVKQVVEKAATEVKKVETVVKETADKAATEVKQAADAVKAVETKVEGAPKK